MKGTVSKLRFNLSRAAFGFMLAMFCAGELVGAALYCGSGIELPDSLKFISGSFFMGRVQSTFIQTVVNSFSGAFILLLICFIMGFGAVFQPAEAAVPFFRGLGAGITLAEINGVYGLKGFALSLAVAVPYAAASGLILSVGARESLIMSCCAAKNIFGRERRDIDIRLYFTKFVILTGALAVASAADGVLTFIFAGLWTRLQGT